MSHLSVNRFHCIPRGQCRNMVGLVWTELDGNVVQYRKEDNRIAIPFSPSSANMAPKSLFIKLPEKINFSQIDIEVWNGQLGQTFSGPGKNM